MTREIIDEGKLVEFLLELAVTDTGPAEQQFIENFKNLVIQPIANVPKGECNWRLASLSDTVPDSVKEALEDAAEELQVLYNVRLR